MTAAGNVTTLLVCGASSSSSVALMLPYAARTNHFWYLPRVFQLLTALLQNVACCMLMVRCVMVYHVATCRFYLRKLFLIAAIGEHDCKQ